MGEPRCTLSVALPLAPLFDIVPQNSYLRAADSEETFTAFANACAQAGTAKCLPASMIHGNATGPDIRQLFTSTIDVSLFIPMYVSCEEAEPGPKLALKLQRIGFTELPLQSGELKCKSCTSHLFPSIWN